MNSDSNDISPFKRILINVLDQWKYQILNDKCTVDTIESISDLAMENLDVDVSIDGLTHLFDKSENAVYSMLSRGYVGKPKRKVYYNLMKVLRILPKSWFKR